MNVAPLAVFQTLKAMCAGQKISDTIAPDTSTVSEIRGQSSASGSALIMLLNWADLCFMTSELTIAQELKQNEIKILFV